MTTINPPKNSPVSAPSFANAFRKAMSQPQFLAAFAVIFIAGLSLSAATSYMRLYFKKEPVPLAKPLPQIPPQLGHWLQVSRDTEMDPEMLDVLGTKQYIFRDYADTRLVNAQTLDRFKDKIPTERSVLAAQLQMENPASVVRLSVTYYTGMVDTVAHIPDRCYVADGLEPLSKETPVWMIKSPDGDDQPMQVSVIHFDGGDPNHKAVLKNVAYVFHCNGSFEYDAITGVRRRLQNLTVRQCYYAKIELMTQMEDQAKSDEVMGDFLSSALPEIQACLPDWQKVTAAANNTATSNTATGGTATGDTATGDGGKK